MYVACSDTKDFLSSLVALIISAMRFLFIVSQMEFPT